MGAGMVIGLLLNFHQPFLPRSQNKSSIMRLRSCALVFTDAWIDIETPEHMKESEETIRLKWI